MDQSIALPHRRPAPAETGLVEAQWFPVHDARAQTRYNPTRRCADASGAFLRVLEPGSGNRRTARREPSASVKGTTVTATQASQGIGQSRHPTIRRWNPGAWAAALFTRRIAGKIILPYLALIFALAILATYTVFNLIMETLEEKYREELAAAARSANESMAKLEERQLAALRQMAFTIGVDEAILAEDPEALWTRLGPIAANAHLAYVDVFSATGAQLLALRAREIGEDAESRIDPAAATWAPVSRVINRLVDNVGGSHAGMVATPWGVLFVSATPVLLEETLVGVIATGVPIEEVTARLSQEAGGKGITLYHPNGTVLVSTVAAPIEEIAAALALSPAQTEAALRPRQVLVRPTVTVGGRPYVEVLGPLIIRREPALVLGTGNLVTIIEERSRQARALMIALFSSVIVGVVTFGLLLAHRIARPVWTLVAGIERIRRNDYDFQLPVQTADETGTVTVAFNEMTRGLRERERARAAIERYMSPKVYRLIQAGELKMGGQGREISVFKTDIRGFSALAETMDAEALVTYLNRYFERMVSAVTKYDGEVDKYMGDSILAKFGATEWYPDHARRAALSMIDMIEACEQLSDELEAEGKPRIHMGIGGNTGYAVVGNVGSPERMEYTIISDAVNTAQRIEELCKELGWDLLISEQMYEQARDVIEVGEPWTVQLRGQTKQTLVYPVLGRAGAVPPHRARRYAELARSRRAL